MYGNVSQQDVSCEGSKFRDKYLLQLWGQLPKSIVQDDITSSDVAVVCLNLGEIGCRWGAGACVQQTVGTACPTPLWSGMKQCSTH